MVRDDLSEKLTFVQRPEEARHMLYGYLGKACPGRKISECKGPEACAPEVLPE